MERDWIEAHEVPSYINEEETPNLAWYVSVHGIESGIMSEWDSTGKYPNREAVYEACIEKGCTWQELLNFNGYKEDVLL